MPWRNAPEFFFRGTGLPTVRKNQPLASAVKHCRFLGTGGLPLPAG